jgi:superoxide dismutase, Cu-Zn family
MIGEINMIKFWKCFLTFFCLTTASIALADISVPMYITAKSGVGKFVGNMHISQTKYGLLFTPQLHDLTPGIHGFHIHQNPSCADNGMSAGGHFDPEKTGKHLGPYNDKGHLGDLPVLYVDSDGSATIPVLAPHLAHLAQIKQRSLMIHDCGDNYSDTPEKLGGGGMRMICGVIK